MNRLLCDNPPADTESCEQWVRRVTQKMAQYDGLDISQLENEMLAMKEGDVYTPACADTDVDDGGDTYMNFVGNCFHCEQPGHPKHKCPHLFPSGQAPHRGGRGGKPDSKGGKQGGKPKGKGGTQHKGGNGRGGKNNTWAPKGGKQAETRVVPMCRHCGYYHFYSETPCAPTGVNATQTDNWRQPPPDNGEAKNGQTPPQGEGA